MTDFLKMDVFFVVATLGVVVLVVLISIMFWYVIRLLRILERIALEVEEEATVLKRDLDEARLAAKSEVKKFLGIFKAVTRSVRRFIKTKGS